MNERSMLRTVRAQVLVAFVCPGLVVLASMLSVGLTFTKEKVDSAGRTIYDVSGQPIQTIDSWATWKVNMVPNLLLLLAGILFVWFGWSLVRIWWAERQPKKLKSLSQG